MKKLLFATLSALSLNAYAISLPVTESMVNSQVAKTFPKTIKKIELTNPQITLLKGKSILCMDGIPRIMFLENQFKVCASFTPNWNQKEARLEATNMEVMEINIKDVGSVPSALKGIISEVLFAIEPLVLYKSDSWFLKQVSAIEVEKGILYLKY